MAHKTQQKGYIKRYLVFQFRDKAIVLLLGLVFIGGTIIGSRVTSSDSSGQIAALLQSLLGGKGIADWEQDFLASLLSAFGGNALLIAGLFLCGFCAVSQPIIIFILLFRGLGFGLLGGYLYGVGQKGAVLYYALVVLPEMMASVIVLVAAAREALSFTKNFLQVLLPTVQSVNRKNEIPVRAYCFRFVLILLLSAVMSLVIALIKTTYFSFIN